jgi:hypothetical protein
LKIVEGLPRGINKHQEKEAIMVNPDLKIKIDMLKVAKVLVQVQQPIKN